MTVLSQSPLRMHLALTGFKLTKIRSMKWKWCLSNPRCRRSKSTIKLHSIPRRNFPDSRTSTATHLETPIRFPPLKCNSTNPSSKKNPQWNPSQLEDTVRFFISCPKNKLRLTKRMLPPAQNLKHLRNPNNLHWRKNPKRTVRNLANLLLTISVWTLKSK